MTKPDIIEIAARAICGEVSDVGYDALPDTATYLERKTYVDRAILDKDEALSVAQAALSALHEAGFVVVPVEPTEAMVRTGAAVLDHPSVFMGGPSRQNLRNAEACYRAMIQAAQVPHDEA